MPLQSLRFGDKVVDQHYAPKGLVLGDGGTSVALLQHGTITIDPPSIAAGASGTATATLPGALTTDTVILIPPSNLHQDLVFQGASVTAANTVTVRLRNQGAAAVDDTAKAWTYILLRA